MSESQYTSKYNETPIGAGYYAVRHMTSKSGNCYQKLVKADRSPAPLFNPLTLKPITGKRVRIKHRARTSARLNREV